MKKKIFALICSLILGFSTLTLGACSGGSGGGGGNNNEMEDMVQKPSPEPPQKGENETNSAKFEDYFDGYRVLIDGDSSFAMFDDATSSQKTFNYLLNRQINTLAQDVLYRLQCVYGAVSYLNIEENHSHKLNTADNPALGAIKKSKLLSDSSEGVSVDSISSYQKYFSNGGNSGYLYYEGVLDLRDAITGNYQYYFRFGKDQYLKIQDSTSNNKLVRADTQLLYDSNNNGVKDEGETYRSAYNANDYKWKFSEAFQYDTENGTIAAVKNDKLNQFKMAIAKMLAGEDYLNDTYSENDYNNLLNRINRLGFYVKPAENANASVVYDDEKVLNYVYKNIIGENLITRDNNCYSKFTAAEKSSFENLSVEPIWTADNEVEKHYYKGYNIVVPNIVKMAFSNKFDDGKTLYPICLRTNIYDGNFETKGEPNPEEGTPAEMTTTGPIKFNSLILKPKDGSLPNEFTLSVAVARDTELGSAPGDITSTRYLKDIYVEFKVNMVYVTEKGKGFNKIVTASKEEETLTVDSLGYKPEPPTVMGEPVGGDAFENMGYLPFQFSFSVTDHLDNPPPSLGAYNGSSATLSDMTIWNNAFMPNSSNSALVFNAGSNYLQISFVNVVVKQRTSSGDVVYTGNDVVYDISVMPLNF